MAWRSRRGIPKSPDPWVVLERIGGRTLDEKVSTRGGDGDVNGALPFFLPWLLSQFGIRFQFILRLHYVSFPIAEERIDKAQTFDPSHKTRKPSRWVGQTRDNSKYHAIRIAWDLSRSKVDG